MWIPFSFFPAQMLAGIIVFTITFFVLSSAISSVLIDLADLSCSFLFQLADELVFLGLAQGRVILHRPDLCIVLPVYLVDLLLPGAGGIRVGICSAVAAAKNNIPPV